MALPQKCPLCYADSDLQVAVTSHVYGDVTFRRAFFHCLNCDVRYQYPGLTSEEEARFYTAEFEGFMSGRAGKNGGWQAVDDHIKANEGTRLRRIRYLMPQIRPSSRILEVGCSSGFMLLPLVSQGHDCVGIEPSGFFSKHLKEKGLSIFESLEQLDTQTFAGSFDLIMHFFVLEHIADPFQFIMSQLDLLKSGGKLIFEIPNVADPLYSIYDIPAFERFYWSVAHPWYFSEKSLRYLLNRTKQSYEIALDQRYDLSNHMIWARDGRPGGMGRFTDELGSDLEESYKQALVRIGKCDTLLGFIVKK